MELFENADQFEEVGVDERDEREYDGDFVLAPPGGVGFWSCRPLDDEHHQVSAAAQQQQHYEIGRYSP